MSIPFQSSAGSLGTEMHGMPIQKLTQELYRISPGKQAALYDEQTISPQ